MRDHEAALPRPPLSIVDAALRCLILVAHDAKLNSNRVSPLSATEELYPAGTVVQLGGATLGKITMFPWFISPWEAARVSLEAQRLLAFPFLGFTLGQGRRRKGRPIEAHLVDQSVVGSLEPEMSATSVATGLSKTRPTRKATGAIAQPIGVKARSRKNVKDRTARRKHGGRRK